MRHRAPALWLVMVAIAGATITAVVADADIAAAVLVVTLLCAAAARLIRRGRQPEGLAVRAVWVDVLVLVSLAVGIALLAVTG